jgi:hypothetical protein
MCCATDRSASARTPAIRGDSGASKERQWSDSGATVERQWSDSGATKEILVATYSRQWSGYTRMKKIIRV